MVRGERKQRKPGKTYMGRKGGLGIDTTRNLMGEGQRMKFFGTPKKKEEKK